MTDLGSLQSPFGGAPVIHLREVDSTMAEARRRLAENPRSLDGAVIVADHQSAGVGRGSGRNWVDEPGENLLFTLILTSNATERLDQRSLRVSLAAALAVAQTVEGVCGLEARIKWPNDVLLRGGKVSGILAEGGSGSLRIGIGLNLNSRGFPEGMRLPATSLLLETGERQERGEILETLLAALHHHLRSPALDLAGVDRRLAWRNEPVIALSREPAGGEGRVSGTLLGLDAAGNPELRTAEGAITLDATRLLSLSRG